MNDTVSLGDKVQYVKKQPVFASLTEEEQQELATLFVEKKYMPGDKIVEQGKSVDSVFLIVAGDADVRVAVVEDNQIKETSVAALRAGQAIGLTETGFYSLSGKRTATVVAVSEMLLLSLNVASFNGFALANSHVGEVMRRNASNMVEP
jgi:signal-transduction protein with cAMP-binding, CBS, and nucleotidyltransferase domain